MLVKTSVVVFLCCLAGCAPSTQHFQPSVDLPEAWTTTQDGTENLDKWWLSFGDPSLDQLITAALTNNFSLRTAWDRLAQERAIAKREGADLSPTLNGTGGVERSRSETDTTTTYDTDWSLGLQVSYELDLWGRIRSTQDAALLDALAAEEDVLVAAITLSADIAARWYEYAEQTQRILIIQEQSRNNQDVLEIITAQFRSGQARAEDVLRQKNLVEANRGDLAVAQQRADTIRLQLAVLVGLTPDAPLPIQTPALVDLPPLPALALPATLLQQRPDVRRAYRAVQAADQRTAAALADRYPRISLSGSVNTTGDRPGDLFDNWAGNLAGNLVQPLLDGGRRQADIERNRALTSEALNDYGQAVLTALQEVETALAQERQQRVYLDSLDLQYQTAQSVIERVRDSYLSGQSEYLNVLAAQTNKQQLELERLAARQELIGYRVDLSRALAGGWALTAPEPAEFHPTDDSPVSLDDQAGLEAGQGFVP